ncbi:uncharacterized protein DDB_G0284459-like isoform X2 [Condylostylus longicornis]|uniref:uncharacterized protein DDB_G0284459-like isoform X2 n=1 Tax=Condylostylus longicornis TaxID=2530218 RepID=UPI00244E47A7|nr:uncharacterized protein DDB_G0284459-like isoform X2 [Condylostylus longicornis]
MAKDALEQFCDLEQSLPKTTICKRNIQNGYITVTSPRKSNDFSGIRKIDNNTPIVIDDDDDEVEEKSDMINHSVEENGFSQTGNLSNGAFQLAVLREVEFNINDVDKANANKVSGVVTTEIKRSRGRPKGYIMKKKETPPETNTKSNTESDDGSEKKNFSLRLGFLGPYQKHKTKTKRDKPSGYSTEDSSPASKRKCGRPMTINVDNENEENSQSNNPAMESISVQSSSNGNSPIDNKINEIHAPEKDDTKSDVKNEDKIKIKENESVNSSQVSEKIINVKPITLEPRRRMGRPKGPPKPPKIRGKPGRKPNPNKPPKIKSVRNVELKTETKVELKTETKVELKTETNVEMKTETDSGIKTERNVENHKPKGLKIPGRRGRPKLYPDRPPKIKVPGRKVGRPPGPPKPFKPRGPRGRPRLIKVNTSDRPYIKYENESPITQIENNHTIEAKLENGLTSDILPTKKRGRPIGYSPIGKTKKRLGRPPVKSRYKLKRDKALGIRGGRGIGKRRGRPRKYPIKTDENYEMNNETNYELTIKNDINNKPDDDDDDECSDISVTDKNWETVLEDSQNDSETNLIIKDDNNDSNDGSDDNDNSSNEDDDKESENNTVGND